MNGWQTGEHDVLLILRNEESGRFHPTFLNGTVTDSNAVVLHSRLCHNTGFERMKDAQADIELLASRLDVPEENIGKGTSIPWDGAPASWTVPDWRRDKPVNVLVVMT